MEPSHFKTLVEGALSAGRVDLAESLLRSMPAPVSASAPGLMLAANVQRAKGDLAASRLLLGQIPTDAPEHAQAIALAAVLDQKDAPAAAAGVAPVPFAVMRDLLSQSELRDLRAFAVANEGAFRIGRVKAAGKIEKLSRSAMVWQGLPRLPVDLQPRVAAAVRRNALRLGVKQEPRGRYEIEISAYGDGDFVDAHWDRGDGITNGRRVTSLFYFHVDPPTFDGGQLRLHDTGPNGAFEKAHWTGFAALTNTLLQFRSEAVHAVTPVRGPTDFASSRFCLTFWAWQ